MEEVPGTSGGRTLLHGEIKTHLVKIKRAELPPGFGPCYIEIYPHEDIDYRFLHVYHPNLKMIPFMKKDEKCFISILGDTQKVVDIVIPFKE